MKWKKIENQKLVSPPIFDKDIGLANSHINRGWLLDHGYSEWDDESIDEWNNTNDQDFIAFNEACEHFRSIILEIRSLMSISDFMGSYDDLSGFFQHESFKTDRGTKLGIALNSYLDICENRGSKIGLSYPAWHEKCWQNYENGGSGGVIIPITIMLNTTEFDIGEYSTEDEIDINLYDHFQPRRSDGEDDGFIFSVIDDTLPEGIEILSEGSLVGRFVNEGDNIIRCRIALLSDESIYVDVTISYISVDPAIEVNIENDRISLSDLTVNEPMEVNLVDLAGVSVNIGDIEFIPEEDDPNYEVPDWLEFTGDGILRGTPTEASEFSIMMNVYSMENGEKYGSIIISFKVEAAAVPEEGKGQTIENPWSYEDIFDENGNATSEGLSRISSDSERFVKVQLTGGTKYTVYATNGESDSYIIFYDANGNNEIGRVDGDCRNIGREIGQDGFGDMDAGDYDKVGFAYTPAETKEFIICFTSFDYVDAGDMPYIDYTAASITPPPGANVEPDIPDTPGGEADIPTNGLVFHASLQEQQDTAETGQNLTYHGEISHEVVDGIACAKFNPEAGSYISFEDGDLPEGYGSRTISVWCRLNRYSDSAAITISYGRGGESGIALEVLPDGAINVSNIQNDAPTDPDTVKLNTWYHILATVEYTEDEYFEVKIYMNGQLLNTDTDRYFDTSLTGTGQIVGYDDANYLIDGYVAGCRIYDRVLSLDEIQKLSMEFTVTGGEEGDGEQTQQTGLNLKCSDNTPASIRINVEGDYLQVADADLPEWVINRRYNDTSVYKRSEYNTELDSDMYLLCFNQEEEGYEPDTYWTIVYLSEYGTEEYIITEGYDEQSIGSGDYTFISPVDYETFTITITETGSASGPGGEGVDDTDIPTNGLIFHAPLSEYSDTAATGQGLNYNGNITFGRQHGIPCAYFDGYGQIYTDESIGISGNHPVTVAAMFESIGDYREWVGVVLFGDTGRECGTIVLGTYNNQIFGSSNMHDIFSEIEASGKMFHGAVVSDGETLSLYVDGNLIGSITVAFKLDDTCLIISGENDSDSMRFNGAVAAVRVYDRALSENEIKALSNEFNEELKTQITTYVDEVSTNKTTAVNASNELNEYVETLNELNNTLDEIIG